jgi:hypothetical protein
LAPNHKLMLHQPLTGCTVRVLSIGRERERVSSLIALPVRGLAELYQPEDQYFPHTMRGCAELTGPQLRPEGDDLRYAAIVALGLASYPP